MASPLNVKQTIACIEASSVALGYRILDQISKFDDIRLLEASTVGGGNFWILASGTGKSFSYFQSVMKASLEGVGENAVAAMVDHEILDLKDNRLLEALYSLSAEPLAESLLVIEGDSISGVLSSSLASLEQHDLKIIEIRVSRGARPGAYAFLTGSLVDCQLGAATARTKLQSRMSRGFVEVIETPNDIFRRQFNFSGEL